jgi:hypothetical protein
MKDGHDAELSVLDRIHYLNERKHMDLYQRYLKGPNLRIICTLYRICSISEYLAT